jgi:hypothetical protein
MSRNRIFYFLAFATGLGCAGMLIWLARASFNPPALRPKRGSAPASVAPPAPPTMAPPALARAPSPAAEALLAALERALARRDARPREAVLTFKDDDALRRFLDRARVAGLTILGQIPGLRTIRVGFDGPGRLQGDLFDNAGDYSSVSANNLITIPSAPSKEARAAVDQVPFGNDTLAFIGASGDRSSWGRGTTIAVLDTGVGADATFSPGQVRALDLGLGTAPGHGNEDGHGTAVAALAAGAARDAPGVAPAADILSIRVTDANGTSDLFTISQAIITAVEAGAKIINVSLGGYATGPVLDAALTFATERGALVVAAAGNDQAAQLAWPAADPRVISVGAVDRAEQQVSFSNSGAQLQLTAPGYGVQTAWLDGQRVYVDGTSASAPLVAGAIATLISQNPNLTPQQAAALLARTANDGGAPGADPAFGRGIVNLATALNSSNSNYVDTAISSHFYDAVNHQMQFVVQNRSGRTVSGMMLAVGANSNTTTLSVPSLAGGETYVARVPVSSISVQAGAGITFTTQLTNPLGVVDQVPANNTRASVLTPPTH